MGNSVQQYRATIGSYAGRMSSSSWSSCPGAFRPPVSRDTDHPGTFRPPLSTTTVWYCVTLVVVTGMALLLVPTQHREVGARMQGTLSTQEGYVTERTAGQVRTLLLLLSSRVESIS